MNEFSLQHYTISVMKLKTDYKMCPELSLLGPVGPG